MMSYAPLSGLALAPKKPRTAATAILRIAALAAEPFAKLLSVRRNSETGNAVPGVVPIRIRVVTRHRISAPYRCRPCPTRTERKPTAEFRRWCLVLARDLIGWHRDLVRPFLVDPVRAQFALAMGHVLTEMKSSGTGAVAFSRSGSPDVGEFDKAMILKTFGDGHSTACPGAKPPSSKRTNGSAT
jgi:hypothetical protein